AAAAHEERRVLGARHRLPDAEAHERGVGRRVHRLSSGAEGLGRGARPAFLQVSISSSVITGFTLHGGGPVRLISTTGAGLGFSVFSAVGFSSGLSVPWASAADAKAEMKNAIRIFMGVLESGRLPILSGEAPWPST